MSSRSARFSFSIPEAYGGFADTGGIAKVTESGVSLEFEIEDGPFGVSRSGIKEVKLAAAQVRSAGLKVGWFQNRLILEAYTLGATSNVPGSRQGRVVLKIPRQEREIAKQAESLLQVGLIQEESGRLSVQRSVKLPFSLPYVYYDDLRTYRASGLAGISEYGVVFEFEFPNTVLDAVGSDAGEARLDLFEIRSVELKTGWFSHKLIVEAASLSATNGIPGSKRGQVVLKVPRREREAAKQAQSLLGAGLARAEVEGLKKELGERRNEGIDGD